MVHQAML